MIDESPDDGEMLTEGRRSCAAIATRRQSSSSVNVIRWSPPPGSRMNVTTVLVAKSRRFLRRRGGRVAAEKAPRCPWIAGVWRWRGGAGQLTLDDDKRLVPRAVRGARSRRRASGPRVAPRMAESFGGMISANDPGTMIAVSATRRSAEGRTGDGTCCDIEHLSGHVACSQFASRTGHTSSGSSVRGRPVGMFTTRRRATASPTPAGTRPTRSCRGSWVASTATCDA